MVAAIANPEVYLKAMRASTELEEETLALSRRARTPRDDAWETLIRDSNGAGNRDIDPEGIQLAGQRDAEIVSGRVRPIDHAEFLRRTGQTRMIVEYHLLTAVYTKCHILRR